MEGLSKTPDEIKKGLGWCSRDTTLCTEACPYYGSLSNGVDCANELQADALAYIQQLERERDAAVEDLRVARHCRTCKNSGCEPSDQPCLSCGIGGKNYKWRGAKDTHTGASDGCTGASGV